MRCDTGVLHCYREVTLFRRKLAVENQFGQSKDAVHLGDLLESF